MQKSLHQKKQITGCTFTWFSLARNSESAHSFLWGIPQDLCRKCLVADWLTFKKMDLGCLQWYSLYKWNCCVQSNVVYSRTNCSLHYLVLFTWRLFNGHWKGNLISSPTGGWLFHYARLHLLYKMYISWYKTQVDWSRMCLIDVLVDGAFEMKVGIGSLNWKVVGLR